VDWDSRSGAVSKGVTGKIFESVPCPRSNLPEARCRARTSITTSIKGSGRCQSANLRNRFSTWTNLALHAARSWVRRETWFLWLCAQPSHIFKRSGTLHMSLTLERFRWDPLPPVFQMVSDVNFRDKELNRLWESFHMFQRPKGYIATKPMIHLSTAFGIFGRNI
jgi:hypothetical protein